MSSSSNLSRYIQNLQRLLVFGRPTIEELRQDLRALLMKLPSGLDITKPELKAAWERGEHDRFIPMQDLRASVSGGKSERIGLPVRPAESFLSDG